MGRERV
jgi:hypothetical protein